MSPIQLSPPSLALAHEEVRTVEVPIGEVQRGLECRMKGRVGNGRSQGGKGGLAV